MPLTKSDGFYERLYRPHVHFSPSVGFINDPCGLVYDGEQYHLYYQFRPLGNLLNEVDWGHAVSPDLYLWEDRDHVIVTNATTGMAFTGSVVVDANNTSSFFPEEYGSTDTSRLVAVYTRFHQSAGAPPKAVTHAAWSGDGGNHYQEYAHNPVQDSHDVNVRDPQVFWYQPGQIWVMTLASAYKREILFYGSRDLTTWEHLSTFGAAGYQGIEFECPNLVELVIEGESTRKWVLFVSINPGSPLGGSTTQYFVGVFDGRTFIPDDGIIAFTDFAKDSYALQFFNHAPYGLKCGVSWFGNWQYCFFQPPEGWSGAMTLPRQFHLRRNYLDQFVLVQQPIGIDKLIDRTLISEHFSITYDQADEKTFTLPTQVALDVRLDVDVTRNVDPYGWLSIEFSNHDGELLSLGYQYQTKTFWIDRGGLRGFKNPTFSRNFATSLPRDSQGFQAQIILDGCTLEVYLNDGEAVGTSLIFPKAALDTLTLRSSQLGVDVRKFDVNVLKATVKGRDLL